MGGVRVEVARGYVGDCGAAMPGGGATAAFRWKWHGVASAWQGGGYAYERSILALSTCLPSSARRTARLRRHGCVYCCGV